MGRKRIAFADAREHQQLRRVERAAGEDHLARRVCLTHLAVFARSVARARGTAARPSGTRHRQRVCRRTTRGSRAHASRCAGGPGAAAARPARVRARPCARGRASSAACSGCPARRRARRASRSGLPWLSRRARSSAGRPTPSRMSRAESMSARRMSRSRNRAVGTASSVCSQPDHPWRLGFMPSRLRNRSGGAVVAVLETLEVPAHLLGAPRPIARDVGNRVPVLVVRVNEDQRVVRRAPAERAGARVEDAIHAGAVPRLAVFRIAPLLHVVGVVPDEEVPAHRLVLGREGVERRDVVVVGQRVRSGRVRVAAGERARVAARFEEQDGETLLGQSRRNGAATGARADDDELGVVRRRRTRSGERGFIRTRTVPAPRRTLTAPGRSACGPAACAGGVESDATRETRADGWTVHGVTSFSGTRSAPACRRR